MKLCITSEGKDLNSHIDTRFGRCKYFMIIDLENMSYEIIENPNLEAAEGAGIQSAQLIANKSVEVVLTGKIGPNAFKTLEAAKIKIITGINGTIKEVINKYKQGEYSFTIQP